MKPIAICFLSNESRLAILMHSSIGNSSTRTKPKTQQKQNDLLQNDRNLLHSFQNRVHQYFIQLYSIRFARETAEKNQKSDVVITGLDQEDRIEITNSRNLALFARIAEISFRIPKFERGENEEKSKQSNRIIIGIFGDPNLYKISENPKVALASASECYRLLSHSVKSHPLDCEVLYFATSSISKTIAVALSDRTLRILSPDLEQLNYCHLDHVPLDVGYVQLSRIMNIENIRVNETGPFGEQVRGELLQSTRVEYILIHHTETCIDLYDLQANRLRTLTTSFVSNSQLMAPFFIADGETIFILDSQTQSLQVMSLNLGMPLIRFTV